MVFFRHPDISFFHLSTDKSTGKDYLSGATNVRLGQHGQLISPPLVIICPGLIGTDTHNKQEKFILATNYMVYMK